MISYEFSESDKSSCETEMFECELIKEQPIERT
jgi:hypothetical protein